MNIHDPKVTLPKVTTGALPASRKVYSSPEAAPDLRGADPRDRIGCVVRRAAFAGLRHHRALQRPGVDHRRGEGSARTRLDWVKERGGVEQYEGRPIQPVDNGNVSGKHLARNFPNTPKPWRASSLPAQRGGWRAQRAGCGECAIER